MLAHQMGILSFGNDFNDVKYGSSICFDEYLNGITGDFTVDILYGYSIPNITSKYGFTYIQEPIKSIKPEESSTFKPSIVSRCNGIQCLLSNIIKYRDSRAIKTNACCTLDTNSASMIIHNSLNCSDTNQNATFCLKWKKYCPNTICNDNNLVYSNELNKCIPKICPQQSLNDIRNSIRFRTPPNNTNDCWKRNDNSNTNRWSQYGNSRLSHYGSFGYIYDCDTSTNNINNNINNNDSNVVYNDLNIIEMKEREMMIQLQIIPDNETYLRLTDDDDIYLGKFGLMKNKHKKEMNSIGKMANWDVY